MKTYKQTIDSIAGQAFSNYIGGAMMPWHGITYSIDTIAFIFNKKRSTVMKDARKTFDRIWDAYCDDAEKRREAQGAR